MPVFPPRSACLAILALCASASSHAGEPPPFVDRAWQRALAELDAAVVARPPPLRPPVPVRVVWKGRRLASIDLRAPLLALAAVDLGGDGRAELVALTTRELMVVGLRGTAAVGARLPLPAEPSPLRSRDPVGTLAIGAGADGALELRARSSDGFEGLVAASRGRDLLADTGRLLDFPLCTGGTAALAAGRNYFTPGPAIGIDPAGDAALGPFFAVGCGRGLVDADGRSVEVTGVAGTDARLTVRVARRCAAGDATCPPPVVVTIPGVGSAVAIADVDHDGRPEVAASGAGAPGDPDRVTVYTVDGQTARRVHQQAFTGGVVALAAGDADGDGADELFAAVRLLGSNQVDLWSLE